MSAPGQVLALSGGVGGARLAHGLSMVCEPGALTVCCNVGDDFEHLGLSISPDIDTVLYTLSDLADRERGWGLSGETWGFMSALARLKAEAWFLMGDQDLATHVERSRRLAAGETLSEATMALADSLGITARVLPVTDDRLRTIVETSEGDLEFQHYFVREQCRPTVTGLRYGGAAQARLSPVVRDLLAGDDLAAIILCPSNPFLSVRPMLAVAELESRLKARRAPVVAVSPIIGGQAVKGPLARIMEQMDLAVSPLGIARLYPGLIDGLMIDGEDQALAPAIRELGVAVEVGPILMRDDEGRRGLAERALAFADRLEVGLS